MSSLDKPKSEYLCKICDYICYKKSNLDKHNLTEKHKKVAGTNVAKEKVAKFSCKFCEVECSYKSEYNRHILTTKHKSLLGGLVKSSQEIDYAIVLNAVLSDNKELRNFIIEQATEHKKDTIDIVNKVIENSKVNNTINGNVTNNNQKFNINMFLNEQCKDAMNLSDFIKNIEVSYEDLENNAQLGFVNGISKIIMDNLKQLGVNERPIHCTDLKRETMYIKDDNKWTREEDNTKLCGVVQSISRKSIGTLLDWKHENPDYKDSYSAFSERCIVMQQQSMAGYNREVYFPKVIHAIARETMVDK